MDMKEENHFLLGGRIMNFQTEKRWRKCCLGFVENLHKLWGCVQSNNGTKVRGNSRNVVWNTLPSS